VVHKITRANLLVQRISLGMQHNYRWLAGLVDVSDVVDS